MPRFVRHAIRIGLTVLYALAAVATVQPWIGSLLHK